MKNEKIFCSAIIVAGGSGTRIDSQVAKQFLILKDKPILAHTIEKFESSNEISEIILVLPKGTIEYFNEELLHKYKYEKIKKIVEGGKERQHSVYNGLKAINPNADIVLIHDGVRPFVSVQEIKKIIDQTIKTGSCSLGAKVKDTIKICNENNYIEETLPRNKLWAIYTPQAFKREIIIKAHEEAKKQNFIGTDDTSLVENLGIKTEIVPGSYYNIKITTKEDLILGEAIINNLYV